MDSGAFRRIQQAIVRGEIAPGSAISEAQLARTYGISQKPLLNVLHRLEEQRLLVRHQRMGLSVVDLSEAALVEMYEVRESLEGTACRLAAERMSEGAISELRRLLDRHALVGRDQLLQENLDFHYRIIQNCGNRALMRMLGSELYPQLQMYRSQLNTAADAFQEDGEYQAIVDAIERRDGECAEYFMRRHIGACKQHIKRYFLAVSGTA